MKLVFDYDPTLNLDLIEKTLGELYPEYPLKNKAKVLRLRKSAISIVGIDVKEDFDNKQIIVQIYHKPSLGAQLFTGAIVQQTAAPFIGEVGLSLKTRLAARYHLIEETNKVKPRWTTRSKIGVLFLSTLFLSLTLGTIIYNVNRNMHTLIYEIAEDGHFDYDGTEIRGGKVYSYTGIDDTPHTVYISKDSTYFYNATNDDWILYSVDYKVPYKSVDIPESVAIWVPAHSIIACEKFNEHVWSWDPSSTTTLYERDIQRGYKREFFLQESTKALENLAALYEE